MALLLALLILPGQALARGNVLDIREVTSPGGIKAWLVEDHSVPVISMDFAFKGAGALLDPPDKQGLSHMVSNTMDEGAGDLDAQAFQKELRDLSVSLSFGSTRDDFTGSLKTVTDNKDRAFELMTLALTKPRFETEAIERMRAANQSRVRSSLSDPDWIAARLLNDRVFAGHVYAQNSGGSLTSLGAITPDDIRHFHDSYFGKNNLVIAVAGAITPKELGAALDHVFGNLPAVSLPAVPPVTKLQNAGQTLVYKKHIPQTIIQMLQPGIGRHDPDYHTAQVMNFVLGSSGFGSRLTEEIREKRGLTYGIYSALMNMRFFDGLSVETSTENKNAGQVVDLTKAEWKKMKDAPITAGELKDAQTYLIGSLPLSLTSTDSISGLLLTLQVEDLPLDYLDRRERAILAVTPEDVQRVAKKILDENALAVILVGEPEGLADFKAVDTIPNAE